MAKTASIPTFYELFDICFKDYIRKFPQKTTTLITPEIRTTIPTLQYGLRLCNNHLKLSPQFNKNENIQQYFNFCKQIFPSISKYSIVTNEQIPSSSALKTISIIEYYTAYFVSQVKEVSRKMIEEYFSSEQFTLSFTKEDCKILTYKDKKSKFDVQNDFVTTVLQFHDIFNQGILIQTEEDKKEWEECLTQACVLYNIDRKKMNFVNANTITTYKLVMNNALTCFLTYLQKKYMQYYFENELLLKQISIFSQNVQYIYLQDIILIHFLNLSDNLIPKSSKSIPSSPLSFSFSPSTYVSFVNDKLTISATPSPYCSLNTHLLLIIYKKYLRYIKNNKRDNVSSFTNDEQYYNTLKQLFLVFAIIFIFPLPDNDTVTLLQHRPTKYRKQFLAKLRYCRQLMLKSKHKDTKLSYLTKMLQLLSPLVYSLFLNKNNRASSISFLTEYFNLIIKSFDELC